MYERNDFLLGRGIHMKNELANRIAGCVGQQGLHHGEENATILTMRLSALSEEEVKGFIVFCDYLKNPGNLKPSSYRHLEVP